PTTTAYGTQWTEVVSAEWRRQGGQVVGNRGVDYNTTTDFSSAVTLALADNPDVLFVGGPSQPTALVIRAAREQGFDGGFIVMDQAKFEEMEEIVPRQMLEGSVGIHPAATYPWEGTPAWVAKFHARFGAGRTPVSEVALNYQGMRIVARAMEIAGTASDPEAIRAALPQAAEQFPRSEAPYPVGTVTERGHLEAPVIAARIEGGRYIPLPIPPVE
ncbi:MAG TPA: ABC transporter substrate-binding protein, partial [Longimicrobiaceae bacterium]|nr:ABC transporter substrate-binding protein [Longimicrobiaceae bacterium]